MYRSLGNSQQSGRTSAQVIQKEVNPSHFTPHDMLLLRCPARKEEEISYDFTDFHLEVLRYCHTY